MALRQLLQVPSLFLVLQAAGFVEAALRHQSSQNLVLSYGEDAAASPPMPPSMRCVTIMTVLYFSTYFAIILARWKGMIVGSSSQNAVRIRGRLSLSETIENSVTDALVLAPMLCILMVGARLRAMQLDPSGQGHPQAWAMSMMYLATWAFVVQFAARCVIPCIEECCFSEGTSRALGYFVTALKIAAMVVLYVGFTAIVASVFILEAPPPNPTPPLTPAMQCVTVLTTLYFAIYLCIGTTQTVQQCRAWANQVDYRPHKLEKQMEHATTALQFAPMLCILAVAVRLRALQHGQEPQAWAQAAMFGATWAIVAQTVVLLLVPYLLPGENLDANEDTRGLDWGKHDHPTLKGLAFCISSCWWLAVVILYACIATILTSVFVQEEDPTHIFVPEVKDRPAFLQMKVLATVPVSTAMRCVTILTLLYFGVFVCILLFRAMADKLSESAQRRLETFSDIAKQALAFAPMLCIMMIGMRMRAVQLGRQDPQTWAQHTMWAGTFAVVIQVVIAFAIVFLQRDEDDEEDENHVCRMGCLVAMYVIRYLALLGVYLTMAVLIGALFAMEPDPLHPLHLRPDFEALGPAGLSKNHPA